MTLREVQAYVYTCGSCPKEVLATAGKLPEGFTGDVQVNVDGKQSAVQFFACRKTHVASALKAAMKAAAEAKTGAEEAAPENPTHGGTASDAPSDSDSASPGTPGGIAKPARGRGAKTA